MLCLTPFLCIIVCFHNNRNDAHDEWSISPNATTICCLAIWRRRYGPAATSRSTQYHAASAARSGCTGIGRTRRFLFREYRGRFNGSRPAAATTTTTTTSTTTIYARLWCSSSRWLPRLLWRSNDAPAGKSRTGFQSSNGGQPSNAGKLMFTPMACLMLRHLKLSLVYQTQSHFIVLIYPFHHAGNARRNAISKDVSTRHDAAPRRHACHDAPSWAILLNNSWRRSIPASLPRKFRRRSRVQK